jgi:hypothetical protein
VKGRVVVWALLAIVGAAAAVLSFDTLEALARTCGFPDRLSFLLPITIDAGAAVGTIVWRAGWAPEVARTFAQRLTWALLLLSVGGNAVQHYLSASDLATDWRLVVAVSAIAPAVFGSVVHLAVQIGHTREIEVPEQNPVAEDRQPAGGVASTTTSVASTASDDLVEKARQLMPAGRPTLVKELGISDYQARRVLEVVNASVPPPELATASDERNA